MNTRGLTLLETLVALVILGLAVTGYLQAFAGGVRVADDSRTWTEAVTYAAEALERVKLDPAGVRPAPEEVLPGGFERRVEVRPWGPGVARVTVVVLLPRGGRYELDRLVRSAR